MKKNLLSLLLFGLAVQLYGQTTELDLQNKYFSARNRLKKLFVETGPEPGQSIPTQDIYLHSGVDYIFTGEILTSDGRDSMIPDSLWNDNFANIRIRGNSYNSAFIGVLRVIDKI